MSNTQRIALAVGVFVLLGVLALLGWSYETRRAVPEQGTGAVTVEVTSPGDSEPGTLREALFIADGANGKATVVLRPRTTTLQTARPPLVNSPGRRTWSVPAGAALQ